MRMKTAPFLALLFLIDGVFLVSGCSVLVTSGGTYEREFFHQDATRETIQRQLGNPILTQPFKAPKRLEEVPELEPIAMRLRSHGGMLVAFREDFHYRGWLLEPESQGVYLFFFIMTAGLSEIIFFPQSIAARVAGLIQLHTFQVWFSPEGYYVYHRRIDETQNEQK